MTTTIWELIGYRIYRGWNLDRIPHVIWDFVLQELEDEYK